MEEWLGTRGKIWPCGNNGEFPRDTERIYLAGDDQAQDDQGILNSQEKHMHFKEPLKQYSTSKDGKKMREKRGSFRVSLFFFLLEKMNTKML